MQSAIYLAPKKAFSFICQPPNSPLRHPQYMSREYCGVDPNMRLDAGTTKWEGGELWEFVFLVEGGKLAIALQKPVRLGNHLVWHIVLNYRCWKNGPAFPQHRLLEAAEFQLFVRRYIQAKQNKLLKTANAPNISLPLVGLVSQPLLISLKICFKGST
jgi:hypothetical protein